MKNNFKKPVLLLVIIFSLFFLVGNGWASTKMPSFSLEEVKSGRMVAGEEFSGKVLLISFFATWCPPCVEEIPVLVGLQEKLGDAGFSVLALSVDREGPAKVAQFVQEKKINYPVLMADSKAVMDFGGVYGIPTAFLVNRAGNVVKRYTGYIEPAILEKDINTLLR